MDNIKFNTALKQFGLASLDLAKETLKYPFSGDWKRLVITGLPLLLVTSGTGALIYSVSMRIFRDVTNGIGSGAKSVYRTLFYRRSVRPEQTRFQMPFNLPDPAVRSRAKEEPHVVQKAQPLPPPSEDVAKMRNKALLKLLPQIEKYVLDPMMEKKDLIEGIACSEASLKMWLRSMTLWSLGQAWDSLETQYVQFNNPPIETVDSIIAQVKKMNEEMGAVFEQHKTVENYKEILKAIGESPLSKTDKLTLTGFYFSLEAILKQSVEVAQERDTKIKLNRAKFATHLSAMALSLKHITKAAEVWIDVLREPKPEDQPVAAASQVPPVEDDDLSRNVKEVTENLKTELTEKYFIPLWNSKSEEWKRTALEQVGEGSRATCQSFIRCEVDEKDFFESAQSWGLSTSQTSKLCFLRAVHAMGNNQVALKQSTQALMESLLAQLRPTITEALKRSSKVISKVPLQKVVPPIMDQMIQVLKCCKILTDLYQTGELEESVYVAQKDEQNSDEDEGFVLAAGQGLLKSLVEVMKRVKGADYNSEDLQAIFGSMKPQHSGRKIVKRLRGDGIPIHQTVVDSFNTPQQEKNWIHINKEKIKAVLRIYADQYAAREGNWVSRLFKAHEGVEGSNLVSKLFSIPAKLHAYPVIEEIMKVLFMGIESVVESKGMDAAQKALNDYTSTGTLSTLIGVKVLNCLITKDEQKWEKNLPVLTIAYQYLHPDEQKIVLKHLAVVRPEFNRKLITDNKVSKEITELHAREAKCRAMMDQLLAVLSSLEKNTPDYTNVAIGYQKIKREHELLQFERVRTLVTTVADKTLDLPGDLNTIITKTIFEAMPLLTCQELVKHWIFSIVDLLVQELEETTRSKKEDQLHDPNQETTLSKLISAEQKSAFISSLKSLVQSSYWSFTGFGVNLVSGFATATRIFTYGVDKLAWNMLSEYVDVPISSQSIADKASKEALDFGKDPNGLPASIIESLTEYVADPRLEKKNLI